jgi:aspartate carbamoyltransferase catalytic subunit
MTARNRSLLGIEQLDRKDILKLLALARRMDMRRGRPLLRGKRVALLFYEASTRTRTSFEFAAKALGATTTLITASASSIEKGESLIDTGYTLQALGADAIVMRHPSSGAPNLMARHLDVPIINAGDGMHEHPSQALLDGFTMLSHKRDLRGLRVVIVGDIYHSRVARSDIYLLSKFGAEIVLCGPPELAPAVAEEMAPGVHVSRDLDAALAGADVVMVLRIQKERLAGKKISIEEYVARYQVTPERLRLAKRDAIIMHPGPIIRGMELTGDVADGPKAVILEQVQNGVRVRMAILATVLGVA